MSEFNDIGISRQLHWPRIRKLLTIGLIASALHGVGDMILGWGVEDEQLSGLPRLISAYTGTPDGGILAAALLGLFGMTLEGLSMFGVYRLLAARAPAPPATTSVSKRPRGSGSGAAARRKPLVNVIHPSGVGATTSTR